MYAVCVTFQIAEGAMADFLPLMLENAAASLKGEPGCHQFDVCRDGDEVFLYELYTDAAAFEALLAKEESRDPQPLEPQTVETALPKVTVIAPQPATTSEPADTETGDTPAVAGEPGPDTAPDPAPTVTGATTLPAPGTPTAPTAGDPFAGTIAETGSRATPPAPEDAE